MVAPLFVRAKPQSIFKHDEVHAEPNFGTCDAAKVTTIYSFFIDKANGKPDFYSLVSCASFAIMSLSLSKQTHFGFEVDLLYFFCGYLTLQLMKIKLVLVIVGVSFSYSLTILRFYLSDPTETFQLGLQIQDQDQHSVVIQVHEDSESVPIMNFDALQVNLQLRSQSQSQKCLSDSDRIRLDHCKMELVEMNEKLNQLIWKQFMIKQEVFPDSNIWIKTFKINWIKDITEDLQKVVKNMVEAGFGTECCNMYNIFRSKFLNKCLCRFGLQDINMCDIEYNQHIGNLINPFHIALRILLPIERKLWRHVFSGFSPDCNIFSSLEWRRIEFELWAKFMVLETYYSRFSISHNNFSGKAFLNCGVHSLTREVMRYVEDVSKDRGNASYLDIPVIIQLLENNLEAKLINFKNIDLGYLFMLNNIRYIHLVARNDPLSTILGQEWIQIQASKIMQNIRNYLSCSWKIVLNLMKEKKSMTPNDVVDSLSKFHLHFSNICNAQSTCFVVDDWLKETMRRTVKKMLLPRYENFLGRLKDVLSEEDANRYIKYGMSDIEDRIDQLFSKSKLMKPSSSKKGSKNQISYYKCTSPNCVAMRTVKRGKHGKIIETLYKCTHNHKPVSSMKKKSSIEDLNSLLPSDHVLHDMTDQSFGSHSIKLLNSDAVSICNVDVEAEKYK